MSLTPSRTRYWIQFLVTNAQRVPGASAMVQALNKRDVGALEATIAEHSPGALNVRVLWSTTMDDNKMVHLSAAEAAVRMNWVAALPVLKQAGETFSEPPYPGAGALGLAVRAKSSPQVKALLDLGANPNGMEGSPPLRHLRQKTIYPKKEIGSIRVVKAFAKQGFDAWASVGDKMAGSALPAHLLRNLSLIPCREILAYARATNQRPPQALLDDPKQWWWAVGRCLKQILDHENWQALPLNGPVLQDILKDAHALGLTAGVENAQILTSMVAANIERYADSYPRNREVAKAWIGVCETFIALSDDPEHSTSEVFGHMAQHRGAMGEVASEWVRDHLARRADDANVPARPRPRF